MANGYAGKILRLDLTNRVASTIDTSKYSGKWIGGIQFGIAALWDEIDKNYLSDIATMSGFEPENVVCLMTGPLGGTPVPGSGRCEVCGVAPQSYPRPLFTRGNFGGRFSPMLKYAGYDGIVVKGRASTPVWVRIVDDKVEILDAGTLWGLDTYEVQEEINRQFSPTGYGEWIPTAGDRATTQRPAVVTIGPAGEHLCRTACLCHDHGGAAGQGGFGGVFGSKNLKCIAVVGTGTVQVANPEALLEARVWLKKFSSPEVPGNSGDHYFSNVGGAEPGRNGARYMGGQPGTWGDDNWERATGCHGCDKECRPGFKAGRGTELMCVEAGTATSLDVRINGKNTELTPLACEYVQRMGLNVYDGQYLDLVTKANSLGILGAGKTVNTNLDFTKKDTLAFFQEVVRRTAYREEVGNDLAEGYVRCTTKWGMLADDLQAGYSQFLYNIGQVHHGHTPSWAFQSLFQARDLNGHQMLMVEGSKAGYTIGGLGVSLQSPTQSAERVAEIAAPWHDPLTADNNPDHLYDLPMARMCAFHTYYMKSYLNAAIMCDWNTPSYFNNRAVDGKGITPEYETRFLNAITGKNLSYEEGLETGRRAWNFERAILCLMDKHRDEEYFPPYPPYDSWVYNPNSTRFLSTSTDAGVLLCYKDGVWKYAKAGVALSKAKHDEFKTIYYDLEGWDTKTGRPTRAGLEACGLKEVADVLEAEGKLGGTVSLQPTSITIKTTATTTSIGKTPTLSGAVTPLGMIGKNIEVYVKKPGKTYYSYSSRRTVYALGGGAAWLYKYYFKPGMAKGTYKFKAVIAGDGEFAGSTSSVISLVLK